MSGYEVTDPDFRQIITNPDWQDIARPLLEEWFCYKIDGHGAQAKVIARDGEEVDLGELYRRIQTNRQMQYDLYQSAMSVWR